MDTKLFKSRRNNYVFVIQGIENLKWIFYIKKRKGLANFTSPNRQRGEGRTAQAEDSQFTTNKKKLHLNLIIVGRA